MSINSDNQEMEHTIDHPDLKQELEDYSQGKENKVLHESQAIMKILPANNTPLQHGNIMEFKMLKELNGYWSDCMFPYKMKGQYVEWGVDEQTAGFLTGIVGMLRPQVLLETGTNRGRSTRAILDGLVENPTGHLWTVDMQDYGLFVSGALEENQHDLVTQVLGKLPGAFIAEPLKDLVDIDFAFIDAGHKGEQLRQDIEFVDAHRADECWVIVHDTKSEWWDEIPKFMREYTKYPVISMRSMNGTDMIWMK